MLSCGMSTFLEEGFTGEEYVRNLDAHTFETFRNWSAA